MARAIWTGAVSFGLVNVPVKAYAAVKDHAVHFHRLGPDQTRTIDVTDFVELEAIDPIFYAHTYWLAPDGKPARKSA